MLFVDTFTNYFEPENAHAALAVLRAAGYRRSHRAAGRTMRAAGRCAAAAPISRPEWSIEAKAEARRMVAALLPHVERGAAVVGLEPSCLLSMRDEFLVMGLGATPQSVLRQCVPDRGVSGARAPRRTSASAACRRCREKRALLARALPPESVRRADRDAGEVLGLVPGLQVESSNRVAAAWRAASATTRRTTTCRCEWPSCR